MRRKHRKKQMICVFLCILILFLITSSAGFALLSLLQLTPRNPFLAFFAGFFLVSLLAMAVCLVTPLTLPFSLLCFSPALFGLKQLRRLLTFSTGQHGRRLIILAFFFAISGACALGASDAAWPNRAYDTDLYHIQIVRWLNEYGTPFGLGNLHSRLSNSSIWPIFAALLNHSFLHDSTPWIMMPTFITAFTMFFVHDFIENSSRTVSAYALCMFPVCIYSIPFWGYPNLHHDFPSLAVLCISGAEFLHMLFSKQGATLNAAASVTMCITISFLIKPLSAVSILLITPITLYCHYTSSKVKLSNFFKILISPIFAATLWCTRNVFTSGYPFFPITLLPFKVDWAMRFADVVDNAIAVRAWARMPGPNYLDALERGFSFWFLPWAKALISSKPQILTILLPFIAGCACWFFVRKQISSRKVFCLFVWPLLSIVYWLWMAPDPRFGRELFWLFFALGVACLVQYWPVPRTSFLNNFIDCNDTQRLLCVVITIFLMFASSTISFIHGFQSNSITWIALGTTKPLPTKLVTSENGDAPFDVYVPTEDDRCGNSPLPCAPTVPQHIIRRDAKNLGAGFRPKPPQ